MSITFETNKEMRKLADGKLKTPSKPIQKHSKKEEMDEGKWMGGEIVTGDWDTGKNN